MQLCVPRASSPEGHLRHVCLQNQTGSARKLRHWLDLVKGNGAGEGGMLPLVGILERHLILKQRTDDHWMAS